MNAPVHFKQQLALELNARATALSASDPSGRPAVVRLRAPRRRRMSLTVGVAAAAVAVAVAVPLASGSSHSTRRSAPTARGPVTAPGTPAADRLNIVTADYAVQAEAGGKVLVRLFDPKGVAGLRAALEKAGVPAAVMVPEASCHAATVPDDSGHGNLTKVLPPSGGRSGPDGLQQLIDPAAIPAGDHLLLVARFDGPVNALTVELVRRLPSCVPSA